MCWRRLIHLALFAHKAIEICLTWPKTWNLNEVIGLKISVGRDIRRTSLIMTSVEKSFIFIWPEVKRGQSREDYERRPIYKVIYCYFSHRRRSTSNICSRRRLQLTTDEAHQTYAAEWKLQSKSLSLFLKIIIVFF